jgi:methylmalonyl-CoA/ethylmalonyl-CoA epimerase
MMENDAGSVGVSGIRQIALNVKDLERAKMFYRDTLGLKFLFDAPPQMSFFDVNGVRLLLGKAETPEQDRPASILYYLVKDINASHAALVAKGAHVEGEPHLVARMPDHDLWLGFYRDSEENTFGLMSEVTR